MNQRFLFRILQGALIGLGVLGAIVLLFVLLLLSALL